MTAGCAVVASGAFVFVFVGLLLLHGSFVPLCCWWLLLLLLLLLAGRLVAKHSLSKQKRIQAAFLKNRRHVEFAHWIKRTPATSETDKDGENERVDE